MMDQTQGVFQAWMIALRDFSTMEVDLNALMM